MQPLNQFRAFEQREATTSEFDVELDLILRSPFRKLRPYCQLPFTVTPVSLTTQPCNAEALTSSLPEARTDSE